MSQKGSGERGVKEKSLNASKIEVVIDGAVPSCTGDSGNAAKEVVSPSVVDETVTKEKQSSLLDTTFGSYPPLLTHGTTTAGNTPSKSSYANVTSKLSRTKVNFHTLFTSGGNGIDVVFPAESIRAIKILGVNMDWFDQRLARLLGYSPFNLALWMHSDVNLMKEDVGTIQVWVKLYGVPVTAFNEDGLSAIVTKLADVELKDKIGVAMPNITGESYYTCNIRVEYEWKPPSCPSTTPVIKKIDKIEKLIIDGKVTLVDHEGKPLEKVDYSGDYDSEPEVASINNEMANFLAKKDGYGTQSLLEQWKESYENDDYEYDPYDDNMYEGQKIPKNLQAICDNLDIRVTGRRKK
ncbi:hypothetical protein Tco_1475124 [Tanacetum coccineum]